MMRTCVDAFLDAVEQGTVGALADVFAEDAVLDATVPHWRFCVQGEMDVRGQLSGWFANPGHFAELRRTPLEGGELVEFDLRWMEDGVLNAAHQAHHLDVENDRITRVAVWCGGRWPASLLAEMEAAAS